MSWFLECYELGSIWSVTLYIYIFSDSDNIATDESYVLINIISTKLGFQLKLSQGLESSTFVAEIFKAIEKHSAQHVVERREFHWLQKYTGPRNGDSNDLLTTGFDDDVSIFFYFWFLIIWGYCHLTLSRWFSKTLDFEIV